MSDGPTMCTQKSQSWSRIFELRTRLLHRPGPCRLIGHEPMSCRVNQLLRLEFLQGGRSCSYQTARAKERE